MKKFTDFINTVINTIADNLEVVTTSTSRTSHGKKSSESVTTIRRKQQPETAAPEKPKVPLSGTIEHGDAVLKWRISTKECRPISRTAKDGHIVTIQGAVTEGIDNRHKDVLVVSSYWRDTINYARMKITRALVARDPEVTFDSWILPVLAYARNANDDLAREIADEWNDVFLEAHNLMFWRAIGERDLLGKITAEKAIAALKAGHTF